MKKLTNQEQIEILEKVKYKILNEDRAGICEVLTEVLNLPPQNRISWYIPLFTYENAANYGDVTENANGLRSWYWWSAYLKNPRIKFINWMINEIKKQILAEK